MIGKGLGMTSKKGEIRFFWSCFGDLLWFLMTSVMNPLGCEQSPVQTDPCHQTSAFSSPLCYIKCCFVMRRSLLDSGANNDLNLLSAPLWSLINQDPFPFTCVQIKLESFSAFLLFLTDYFCKSQLRKCQLVRHLGFCMRLESFAAKSVYLHNIGTVPLLSRGRFPV